MVQAWGLGSQPWGFQSKLLQTNGTMVENVIAPKNEVAHGGLHADANMESASI